MALNKKDKDDLKRTFILSSEIKDITVGTLVEKILEINEFDDSEDEEFKNYVRDPIRIYINSPGGSVYSMNALIGVMENSKTPIYTYGVGHVMSAGFLIFLAGKKRYGHRFASYMYHGISAYAGGKLEDIEDAKEHFNNLQKLGDSFILDRTKIKKEKLQECHTKRKEWYFGNEEAKELGVIHEEFDPKKIKPIKVETAPGKFENK